jgi:hypothetical protein
MEAKLRELGVEPEGSEGGTALSSEW